MRKRSDEKRDSIIAAAKQLFLQEGSYANTSMDAIAAAAGVAKQTLYGYFSTKEELFIAVVQKCIGEPWDSELSASSIGHITTPTQLRALFENLLNIIASKVLDTEYVPLVRIIIAESATQPKLAALYRQQIPEKGLAMLTHILQVAAKKQLIIANPEVAARMLIGSMLTYFMLDSLLAHGPPKKPSKEQIAAIINEFMAYATKGGVQ